MRSQWIRPLLAATLALAAGAALAAKKAPIDPVSKKPVKITDKTPRLLVNFDPIYFQTAANKAAFLKAPEKYLAKARAECPVRGLKTKPSKSNRLIVNGGLLYFCCTSCPSEFLKNPGDYAPPIKDPVTGEKFSLTADGPHLKIGNAHWYFATDENLAKFKADPAKYSKGAPK